LVCWEMSSRLRSACALVSLEAANGGCAYNALACPSKWNLLAAPTSWRAWSSWYQLAPEEPGALRSRHWILQSARLVVGQPWWWVLSRR
jgi:hypothetical protein